MSSFRATNTVTGEVVEYEAAEPQPQHLAPPWRLEELVTPPPPEDPPPPPPYGGPWTISKFAFRARFANDEKLAIELASLDVPDGTLEARSAAAQVRVWLADIEAAQYVDLQLTATRDGVQTLETFGLLGAGRAAVILDTEPLQTEVWDG